MQLTGFRPQLNADTLAEEHERNFNDCQRGTLTNATEWEHQQGISIQTCDNPGFWVKINLKGTALEHIAFKRVAENIDAEDMPTYRDGCIVMLPMEFGRAPAMRPGWNESLNC